MSDGAEREHAATSRRRTQFAEQGQVVQSRDLIAALVLIGGSLAVLHLGPRTGAALTDMMHATLGDLRRPLDVSLMLSFGMHYCAAVLPIAGIALAAAVTGGFLQHRGVPPFRLPGFNLGKINPIGKVGQLFSPKAMAGKVGMSLVKVAVLAGIFFITLNGPLQAFIQQVPVSLGAGVQAAGALVRQVLVRGLWAMLLFGISDYGITWYKLEKRMRMTSQELRDENKEDNGDPRLKGRRRRMAQELINSRSIKNVPKADVVLVNPTHVAVAVRYDGKKMQAPQVVAKGADAMADQIRALARRHQVPIVSQPPLARQLFASVKVGRAIPAETYQAVATVLAHVYRLRKRAS